MGNTKPKKKSTRRSVSMRGLTYQRIKIYCDREGMAVSDFIETIAGRELDKKGQPVETVLRPRKRANAGPKDGSRHGGIFSW